MRSVFLHDKTAAAAHCGSAGGCSRCRHCCASAAGAWDGRAYAWPHQQYTAAATRSLARATLSAYCSAPRHACTAMRTAVTAGAPPAPQRPSVIAAVRGTAGGSVDEFDDLVLDDAYYEEMGMTRAQALAQQQELLSSIDPEAVPLGLPGLPLPLGQRHQGRPPAVAGHEAGLLPPGLQSALDALEVYGPPAMLMAGFRAEEHAIARAALDAVGAAPVKVLPVTEDMLRGPLDAALATPEIDWSAPRPDGWIMGGGWGSQRVVMFAGLPIDAQATLLELLEAQGLPPVCVTMALREDGMRLLGELMAAAVQAQRGKQTTPPAPAPWDAAGPAAAAAGGGAGGGAPRSGSPGSTDTGKESGGVTLRRGDMTLSGLPGRRGRLFASSSKSQQTQQRGSSSSRDAGTANLGGGAATKGTGGAATGGTGGATALPDGLQPLQELIPPAVARRRLQVPAKPSSSKTDSSSSSSSESAAAAVFDQLQPDIPDDTLMDLLDWVSDESTGPSVELPFSSISNSGKGDTAASEVAADSAAADDDNDTSTAAVAASTDAAVPVVGNSLQTLRSSSVNSAQSASGYPSPPADDTSITNVSLDDIFDSVVATSPQPGTQLRQMGISGSKDSHTTTAVADGDEADDDDAYAQVGNDANSVIGDHQAQAISHQAAGGDEGTDLLDPEPAAMSALQAVRAALSAGVSPEQLSAAMRQAVAAGAAATDPVDLLLQEGDAAAAAAATAAGAATTIDERSKHNSATSRAGGDSGAEQLITTPSLVVEPAASAPSNADLGPTPANLQQQQQQQQPARVVRATYGPEPPPPAAQQQQQQHDADGDAPLLRLRPEIENALRNQQVKFLDMSKLPSKYRRRYERPQQQHPSQQGHQQQQQEQQQQQQQQQEPQHTRRWWASDQRSATRAQLLMSLSGGVSGSLPRGGRVEAVDTGTAQDGLLPQQQMPADSGALLHDGDDDGGDDDDNQGLVAEESPRLIELQQQEQQQQDLLLDGPKLLALRDGTVAAGLDVRVALARAAAYGIIIDDEAAANLGLDMPTAEEVLAARAEIVDSLRDTDHGSDGLELDDVKEEEEEGA